MRIGHSARCIYNGCNETNERNVELNQGAVSVESRKSHDTDSTRDRKVPPEGFYESWMYSGTSARTIMRRLVVTDVVQPKMLEIYDCVELA